MNITMRIATVLSIWAVALVALNPFLEGPKRRYAALGCAIAASIAWVLA